MVSTFWRLAWSLSDLSTIEIKTPYGLSAVKNFTIIRNLVGKSYLIATDGEEVLTFVVSSFEGLLKGADEFKATQRFYTIKVKSYSSTRSNVK